MMSDVSIQDDDVLISFQSIEYLTGIEWQGRPSIELNAVHLWGIELNGSPHFLAGCGKTRVE